MNKASLSIIFSFLLLLTLMVHPVQAGYEPYLFTSKEVAFLYGPPAPSELQTLVSRAGSSLQKEALTITPKTLAYTVKRGDSLYEIAQVFDTTTTELIELNRIANPNLLAVGQELQVPNQEEQQITTDYTIKQVISADLTAYTAGPESTGKSPGHPAYGITASGNYVKDHHTIATDPSVIPLGTKVYIEGIGIRTAEDTGGAILGNRIDVYMNDLSAAVQFGVKRGVKVYILEDTATSA